MRVTLENPVGVIKSAKVGFSWTTLFFGGLVPLFRGEVGEFFKWIVFNVCTIGVWGLIQCFTINKKNVISLLEKGYAPKTDRDRQVLINRGIIG